MRKKEMEISSYFTKRKLLLCSMFLFAVLLPSITTVPMSFAQSASPNASTNAKHATWLVQESISCLNKKFCVNFGGLYTQSISATTFSDKTASVSYSAIFFGRHYKILVQEIMTWVVTDWTVKPVHEVPTFIFVSGTEYISLWYRGYYSQQTSPIHNFNTGVPALQITGGCQQVFGQSCPINVSAILSVTKV
jgi:hypothetical protein